MCKAKLCKNGKSNSRIDKCMTTLVKNLNRLLESLKDGYRVKACCCGHGKYPMTIIVRTKYGHHFDFCSDYLIPRIKKFYKKDSEGYYYIPEVSKPMRSVKQKKE